MTAHLEFSRINYSIIIAIAVSINNGSIHTNPVSFNDVDIISGTIGRINS